MQTVGNRIATARAHKGWSQKRLAEELGCKPEQISMWEVGRRNPRPKARGELASVLGVSYEWLSTGVGTASDHAVSDSTPYRTDPPLDTERLRAVIELAEEFLASLKPSERPSPSRIAGMILKFYEIEVEAAAPIPLMRERIMPFIQALRAG